MAIRVWCRENNINEKKFYYWQRQVKRKVINTIKDAEFQNRTDFVQLLVNIDFSITTPSFKTDMLIGVGNNILELSNTVSENPLSMVLKVMSNVK